MEKQILITLGPDGSLITRSTFPNKLEMIGVLQIALQREVETVLHPQEQGKIIPFKGPLPEPPKDA